MSRKIYYPAIIEKEPDSDFGVFFSDFPGCVSAGDTVDEAMLNAHEALALHVELMVEDGDPLPKPSSIEEIAAQHSETTVAVTLIPVTPPGRIKRINITLDEGLLADIDSVTDNRSRFLAESARAELARRRAA